MKYTLCLLLAASFVLMGCRKKPGARAGTGARQGPANPGPALIEGVDVNKLFQAVYKFHEREGRPARSWEELVEKTYLDKVPKAPPGKQVVFEPNLNYVSVVAIGTEEGQGR